MISSFTNFTQLTTLSTPLPITPAEVRAESQYFKNNRDDTSLDAEINAAILQGVLNWEGETKFLLFDQTFKVFIYNQYTFNQNFVARLPVLNVYELNDVKYYPTDWDYTSPKSTLDTSSYYFTPQVGIDAYKFYCKTNIYTFKMYNNLELNAKGGYENNDFTNIPLEIKNALIMMTADNIDVNNEVCNTYRHKSEVNRIYGKYKIFDLTITI